MSKIAIRPNLIERAADALAKNSTSADEITDDRAHATIESVLGIHIFTSGAQTMGARYYRALSQQALNRLVKDTAKRAREIYRLRNPGGASQAAPILFVSEGSPINAGAIRRAAFDEAIRVVEAARANLHPSISFQAGRAFDIAIRALRDARNESAA